MNTSATQSNTSNNLSDIGEKASLYAIALILLWIGGMKFTTYEAGAIEGLVASSPLTSWLYAVTSLQGASNLIGTVEILIAAALVIGQFHRTIGIIGAVGAIATFATTSSYLLTAPGWEASLGGFPALSVVPGQFLLKDLVLLAVSVKLLGQALERPRN